MKLTDIPNAEEIIASYDNEKIKEIWEERIAKTVRQIFNTVSVANQGGSLNTGVAYKSNSSAEEDYVESRFYEKGFEVFRQGYGELIISWKRKPDSFYLRPKKR